jgi:hypothetical protein
MWYAIPASIAGVPLGHYQYRTVALFPYASRYDERAMPIPAIIPAGTKWELPPLVLHPFSQGPDAATILESAQFSLRALLASDAEEAEIAHVKLLQAKYCEFRMLCLIGKDLLRWIRQCVDFAGRDELLSLASLTEQSFADYLVNRTPAAVVARFESWAVQDYRGILSRAIGLNAIFPHPPDAAVVAPEFLEDYHHYADGLFRCYQQLTPVVQLDRERFSFALFTSDEYMKTLGGDLEEV